MSITDHRIMLFLREFEARGFDAARAAASEIRFGVPVEDALADLLEHWLRIESPFEGLTEDATERLADQIEEEITSAVNSIHWDIRRAIKGALESGVAT